MLIFQLYHLFAFVTLRSKNFSEPNEPLKGKSLQNWMEDEDF